MPARDRTGPFGYGPMTGKGMGRCMRQGNSANFAGSTVRGWGGFRGRMRQRCLGRTNPRWEWHTRAAGSSQTFQHWLDRDSLEYLKRYEQNIQEALKAVQAEIAKREDQAKSTY